MKKTVTILLMLMISLGAIAQTAEEQLALQAFNNKEYDKAIVYYEKLFDKNPWAHYTNYFRCLIMTKDYKRAEKIAKRQLKSNPEMLGIYIDLGEVYLAEGNDRKKAEEQYQKAIKELEDPNQVYNLAQAFINAKEYDFAIQTYMKGRKMYDGAYPFYYEIADVYQLKGDLKSMVNQYLDALDTRGEAELYMVQTRLSNALGYDDEKGGINNPVLKTELLKRIQGNPEKTLFSEFLVWIQLQQKDFEGAFIQSKALDKRKKESGHRLMELGKLCLAEGNYEVAQKAYQYVIDLGLNEPYHDVAVVEAANVLYEKVTRSSNYSQQDLTDLETRLSSTISKFNSGPVTFSLIKKLAHLQAYYINKIPAAVELMNAAIANPAIDKTTQAEMKLELGDILLVGGEIWEASLLYSQVDKAFKHEPIGQEAKYRNAKVSYYSGDFKWAKAQLDVLKGATSKLIANDAMDLSLVISDAIGIDTNAVPLQWFSSAELLIRQNKLKEAFQRMDSIISFFGETTLADDILMKKAFIYTKQAKFQEAADAYQKVVNEFGTEIYGDDALFRLAELNERNLNNAEKAKELYEKILTDYPGSVLTTEARKRYRKLRGDNIN